MTVFYSATNDDDDDDAYYERLRDERLMRERVRAAGFAHIDAMAVDDDAISMGRRLTRARCWALNIAIGLLLWAGIGYVALRVFQ